MEVLILKRLPFDKMSYPHPSYYFCIGGPHNHNLSKEKLKTKGLFVNLTYLTDCLFG